MVGLDVRNLQANFSFAVLTTWLSPLLPWNDEVVKRLWLTAHLSDGP